MKDHLDPCEQEEQGAAQSCCRKESPCCRTKQSQKEAKGEEVTAQASSAEETTTVSILQSHLKQLQNDSEEYKDKYLRVLAEMENMRKRLQKEKQELSKYATESIIVELLAPFDQFENALQYAQQMSDEVKNWAIGFNMILTQLKNVLADQQVHAFESMGSEFNPHLHDAVEMVETEEHPAGFIVKEYTKGYKMGERVIRPARVSVAKGKADSTDDVSSQIKA